MFNTKRNVLKRSLPILILILVFFLILYLWEKKDIVSTEKKNRTTITIAICQNDTVSDYENNYYKNWLEEQTGFEIRFEFIPQQYDKEYLYTLLTGKNGKVDAVFFPEEESFLTKEEFDVYQKSGFLLDISKYMTQESQLNKLFKEYEADYLKQRMTTQDGIYYFPNIDTSRKGRNYQILWINFDWLKKLELQIPTTTEELYAVLEAFRDLDPNQNGKKDEQPLVSCEEKYELQSYQYLINCFIYNNPLHLTMYKEQEGEISFAQLDPDYREGVKYCASLYREGLLSGISFSFSQKQLMELVNAPENMVGAFTSGSIADVIYSNSPDVLANYIQVPPIAGPKGKINTVKKDYKLTIGALIPTNSEHPAEAYELMDLMLSKEASLIAEYGEEGVDWNYSDIGDLSTYGTKARITTLQYLKNKVQNKHFDGAGPQVVSPEYKNGVTWNGDNSLIEYIDARAVKGHEPYYYKEADEVKKALLTIEEEQKKEIQETFDSMLKLFIKGELDVGADLAWSGYMTQCERFRREIVQ